MTARVAVTAGPHDVGFTFRERPSQQQDVWQPSLRDSQEIHIDRRPAAAEDGRRRGSVQRDAASATTPSRERIFVCRPTAAADEPRARNRILLNAGAARLPASGHGRGRRGAAGLLYAGARARRRPSTPASAPASRASWRARRSSIASSAIRPALRPGAARRVSDVELASRLSFFLWSSIPDDAAARPGRRRSAACSRACSPPKCGA